MYAIRIRWRLVGALLIGMWPATVSAQAPQASAEQHDHAAPSPPAEGEGHDMSMLMREGSGTSWLPDSSPMYMLHAQQGPWMLMGHENAFVQFVHTSGRRGADQTGSINWIMGIADRNVANGHLQLRGMFSLEPWTVRGCGYPDLLASGEQCGGGTIHDRQHPHDLPMEVSAEYDAPLAGTTRWQIYGGPAAEPALGPVAFPHRVSALPNPIAPITHHWFDSTHVSFGVLTGSLYGKHWKVETSAFNGREPDENRKDFDFGALDSVSGRIWFLPTANLALQVSAGRLKEAEAGEGVEPRRDVNRTTATATYHRMHEQAVWASTIGWGRNSELGHGTDALLAETNVTLADRDSWFGRFELVGKTAHDLDAVPAVQTCTHCIDLDTFTVAKVQGGYARYVNAGGLKSGLGVELSAVIVPEALRSVYGSRANMGFGVFITFRPAAAAPDAHAGHTVADADAHAGHTEGGAGDHSEHLPQPAAAAPVRAGRPAAEAPSAEPRLPVVAAERVIDPACAATIDVLNAPRATYQGKVYYFCSAADRDAFVNDPAAYLAKRGK